MNKQFLKISAVSVLSLAALAACGGGGGSTPPYINGGSSGNTQGSTEVSPDSVELVSSTATVPSVPTDATAALLTITVKGEGNVVLAGAKVSVSSNDEGGSITLESDTTDDKGEVKAKYTAGTNKTNRTVTITAKAGGKTASTTVKVEGTTLALTGASTMQIGGAVQTFSATALDSNNQPIPNAELKLASANGNTIANPTVKTDASGVATFTVTPTKGGKDTLTVTGLGTTSTFSTTVSPNIVAFTNLKPGAELPVATPRTITVRPTKNGALYAPGTKVTFSSTRGLLSPVNGVASIGADGTASIQLSADNTGATIVTATMPDGVSSSVEVNFIATKPATLNLQSDSQSVPVKSITPLTATVRDAKNNPVKGQTVSFSVVKGKGSVSAATAVTDENGEAKVNFVAGDVTTPTNGVEIVARSGGMAATQLLTISGQALFISVGTGDKIASIENDQYYRKLYSVNVTDSAGTAVANQKVSLKLIFGQYQKGGWALVDDGKGNKAWAKKITAICPNEDTNMNGILDSGEDVNNSGKLEPGAPASLTDVTNFSVTTDNNGRASFNLDYLKSNATWAQVQIHAQARVGGTESNAKTAMNWLPYLVDDTKNTEVDPAFVVSPYGVNASCSKSD